MLRVPDGKTRPADDPRRGRGVDAILRNGLRTRFPRRYPWFGETASAFEKAKAGSSAHNLASARHGKATVKNDPDDAFWAALGGEGPVAPETDCVAESEEPGEGVLYRLSDASGSLACSETARGDIKKSMLDSADVFLLDAGREVFVWIGSGASDAERCNAMSTATAYEAAARESCDGVAASRRRRVAASSRRRGVDAASTRRRRGGVAAALRRPRGGDAASTRHRRRVTAQVPHFGEQAHLDGRPLHQGGVRGHLQERGLDRDHGLGLAKIEREPGFVFTYCSDGSLLKTRPSLRELGLV